LENVFDDLFFNSFPSWIRRRFEEISNKPRKEQRDLERNLLYLTYMMRLYRAIFSDSKSNAPIDKTIMQRVESTTDIPKPILIQMLGLFFNATFIDDNNSV
jgi:hypothetical protein